MPFLFYHQPPRIPYILPVKRQRQNPKTLIVHRPAKDVGQSSRRRARRAHRGQTRDRHGVEPRPDIRGEEFVRKHGHEAVPEPAQRLGVLDILPVQALQRLDGGQGAPVDGVDVPDGDGAHEAADAVAEQADRDDRQDHRRRAERQVVEQILRREHHDAGRRVGRRRGRDGADGVLLEVPRPRVDHGRDRDPERQLALAPGRPPPRRMSVAAREQGGPCGAQEVGDEDDEGAPDGDLSRLELGMGQWGLARVTLGCRYWQHWAAYRVDLVHDGLESRQNGGEEDGPEAQRGLAVVPQRQEMEGGIGASDDDGVVAALALFLAAVGIGHGGNGGDVGRARDSILESLCFVGREAGFLRTGLRPFGVGNIDNGVNAGDRHVGVFADLVGNPRMARQTHEP